jgi:anti-sigma28 factor (negative regulator of flagellin synthesis)
MATVRALSGLPFADRRRSWDTRKNQGRDAAPNGATLILGHRNTTSHEEALKRIASPPPIRHDKVLDIRRQITDGTYEVMDRLDKAIDRVLEALTA